MELKEKSCTIINSEEKPLNKEGISSYLDQLVTKWQVVDHKKIVKEFNFDQYKRAAAFVQEIALIAEKQNHHPDVCLSYGKVNVELSTHDIGGLSENDFIMAARIEDL